LVSSLPSFGISHFVTRLVLGLGGDQGILQPEPYHRGGPGGVHPRAHPSAKAVSGDLPGGILLQAFEIKDYNLGTWEEKGGEKTLTQRFTISTFTTGSYLVPPWGLKYKLDGKEITVQVPALPLVVRSVLKGQEENPKDIRKPMSIPRSDLPCGFISRAQHLLWPPPRRGLFFAAAGGWRVPPPCRPCLRTCAP